MKESDAVIQFEVTCNFGHEKPCVAGSQIQVRQLQRGDFGIIEDVQSRLRAMIEVHFREHHPGIYPPSPVDAYYAAKRKAGGQPTDQQIREEIVLMPELIGRLVIGSEAPNPQP